MNGPETVIALSAVAGNSGPFALILLRDPSKSHSVGGGLKITFSGGWSQNHIQCGMVSKSHSVGGGLKITFSVGWSGPPENIVLGPSHPLGCSVSSSLGPAGIVGGGSECTALSLSTFSTTTRCT